MADFATVLMPSARLEAAGRICQELAPLLGAVDPVALRIEGNIPEPGTIEITIP